MPSQSPLPDNEHELSAYGPSAHASGSSSSYPLLSIPNGHSSPPPIARKKRRSSTSRTVPRWWKPITIASALILLILIYAVVHPNIPGLPALQRVVLQSGSDSANHPSSVYPSEDSKCTCGHTKEGERLCGVYHREALRTTRLVQGTGARVRRMLLAAREGKALKVGVLGGSVSACHGLHPSPDYPQGDPDGPGCYTSLVKVWVRETFPGAEHEFFNGAIGGMDSSYYAFCGTHHIATDADLIILEFDVNDQTDLLYQTFFDQLLRVLLEFKSIPAVVVLGAWAPQVAQDQGYYDPQTVHLPIATYLDVPYISQKRMMWNTYLRWPSSTAQAFYQPDHLHPNARGHRVLADILIAYLETELCLLSRYGLPIIPSHEETLSSTKPFSDLIDIPYPLDTLHLVDPFTAPEGWETTFQPGPLAALASEARHFALPSTPYSISPIGLFAPLRDVLDPSKPDPSSARHILGLPQPKMFCADANDREHPITPTSHEGWESFVWNQEKHYWVSSTPGARIRVEIKVNAGRVAVYYFRSQHYDLGDAQCWVDDNESGAVRLAGYWPKPYNVAVVAYIDEKVTPGDHYVTCEIMLSTSHPTNPAARHFRIVAVMAT